ncbi:hypothetical protein [Flavobacterium psychrophilum]|uniref:hypothetical protein n=1 Tax=Flavobacterium psychrophilum TaxID=96345 RepID=UPI000B7C3D76|nr:hypothetical protein [Flavobacterium psychrophilum]EKT4520532.1 hypothetical protein [Flavobacterium psychrophilum]MCB6070882.1 hypothetical protein [Flavobacterium psychrophilum]MCB6108165.1 hypothetical protein [Flavobacterium psychrophilum]SNB06941.1 conserved hypothetical protein [Flavobacterium psychrophilum]SNB43612.1 conserved hypothetical protein [Flavobacterium psychrophilum]
MPYIFSKNKVAVELEELVPRFWNKTGSLQLELHRYKEKPFGVKRLQLGGNGRKLLIDFDSLTATIQDALGDPRKAEHPMQPYFEWDSEAPVFYSEFKRAGARLKPEEQERYIINASVMKAVLKLEQARIAERINKRKSCAGVIESLRYDVESFQNHLKVKHQVEHTLPVSTRFKDILKDFKTNGHIAIIKDPNGTGKQNARIVTDKYEMLFNGLFKNQTHKPTPTEVARNFEAFLNGYAEVYNEDTGELYNPKDFKKLSIATIINYINKWENKLVTHKARSGDRQVYLGNFKPHHQMDLPTLAGSIISIDDRQPPFVYNKQNDRVWFYLGVDIASQAFTTIVYGKTKEGIIVDFYRQMVRNYTEWGFCLPWELECESSLNSSFKDTLLRPGAMFQEVKIEANNARGKYIERMNGKLRYEVEKDALGWLARPTAKSEANQLSSAKKQIIPYDILVNERMLELEQWNNSAHPEHKNLSRWDYFEANQNPNLKPTNWNAILPVIGHKTPTSCNGGYIKLQGLKRAIAEDGKILTGEALIQQMRTIEGKEFDVYWLDGNDGQVLKAFVYLNDRLICEVIEMPRYNRAKAEQTDACKEAIKLQSAYVASVDAFEKRQRNKIENIQIIDNTPKTVNSNFRMPNLKRFERNEVPKEILDDDNDEFEYVPNQYQSERTLTSTLWK